MDKTCQYVLDNFVDDLYCNECGFAVLKSHTDGYSYQCMHCDEDLFEFEVHKARRTVADKIDLMFENVTLVRELLCLDD